MSANSSKWKCERCKCKIDILVKDEDRTFVNRDGLLFCSQHCSTLDLNNVPKDLSRKPVKKKKRLPKWRPKFECPECGEKYSYMPFNKCCYKCADENGISSRLIPIRR